MILVPLGWVAHTEIPWSTHALAIPRVRALTAGGFSPTITRRRLRLALTATPKRKEAPGFPGASSFFLTLSRESDAVLRLNTDIVEEGTHERAKDERSYRYDH